MKINNDTGEAQDENQVKTVFKYILTDRGLYYELSPIAFFLFKCTFLLKNKLLNMKVV